MSDVLALLDGLARDRLLLFGSLPPEGRDFDLLVRPGARAALEVGLQDAGFAGRPPHWARFRDCTADAVELHAPADWRLPPAETDALFADARPLPGVERVCAPAAHHALLILARRLGGRGATLASRHRSRAQAADAADWERASAAAPAWGVTARLAWLQAAAAGAPATGLARRARAEWLRELGGARIGAAALRRVRPRRGLVVALSGLDGSGKSTQCAALRDTLGRLGVPARVEWTSIVAHPLVFPASRRAKALLRKVLRRSGPRRADDGPRSGTADEPFSLAFRDRAGPLQAAWATVLVVANSLWHRRVTRPARRRGEVVICDRYTLDSCTQLHYAYGSGRLVGRLRGLMRRLSPAPDLAFLLAVSPEAALARNQEYTPEAAARRARFYEEERLALGYERLDGERPADEVCAELAGRVWAGLG